MKPESRLTGPLAGLDAAIDASAARGVSSSTAGGGPPRVDGSILRALRQAAESQGLDIVAELYNEALELAQEGHYGRAQTRLNVLLALAPSDGEAHLLLAKVLVGGQQWRRALQCLDDAAQCEVKVPEDLRQAVLRNLQADEASSEEQARAREAREQGEIGRLRVEARRLRGENVNLVSRAAALEKETARWAWIATGTSVVAIVFILIRVIVGAPTVEAPVEAAPVVATTPAPAADPDSPRDDSLAARAATALTRAGLVEGSDLEVIVRGDKAELSGYVPTWAHAKAAAEVIEGVEGIGSVGTDGVIVLALRDGTTHKVRPGETLGKIAYDHYGRSSLHTKIVEANPELSNPRNLKVNMELKIPPVRLEE